MTVSLQKGLCGLGKYFRTALTVGGQLPEKHPDNALRDINKYEDRQTLFTG